MGALALVTMTEFPNIYAKSVPTVKFNVPVADGSKFVELLTVK